MVDNYDLFRDAILEENFMNFLNGKITLQESVLDPVQKTRCKEIFDSNDIMHEKVKKEIIDRFELWYKQLNQDQKIFDIVGYKMIGSSSGFQYTESSDIDLQVFVKMHNGHDFNETMKLVKILPNGTNLEGTLHPVNYFFIDEQNPTKMENVENLYNLITKKWEKKSEKKDIKIPSNYIKEITRFFTDGFDLIIGRYDRDKQYLLDAFKLDPKTQEISEQEKNEEIDKRIYQLQADIDALWLAEHLIHGFLGEAYNKNTFKISIDYTNDDVRFSANNLIYKTLDRFEYRQKLVEKAREGGKLIADYKEKIKKLNEDCCELFGLNETDYSDLFEDNLSSEKEKIQDVINAIKDVQYGFVDKNGIRRDNRDWIHSCQNLTDYYTVQTNPEITLNSKLGICTDQCIALKYLFNKMHPECNPQLYALTKGRFGHCTFGFEDNGKFFYIENAWDKMKPENEPGLYGPFDNEDALIEFFNNIYHKYHDKDNNDAVIVKRYEEYLKARENLNESL